MLKIYARLDHIYYDSLIAQSSSHVDKPCLQRQMPDMVYSHDVFVQPVIIIWSRLPFVAYAQPICLTANPVSLEGLLLLLMIMFLFHRIDLPHQAPAESTVAMVKVPQSKMISHESFPGSHTPVSRFAALKATTGLAAMEPLRTIYSQALS
jgi:hypothetical protein